MNLIELNANWIQINVAITVDDSMDSTVRRATSADGIPTFNDQDLTQFVRQMRHLGFKICLTMAIENLGDSPGGKQVERWWLGAPQAHIYSSDLYAEYWPWNPSHPQHAEFVEEFYESYGDLAVHFAQLAQDEGVEMFSLGTETDSLFRTQIDLPEWSTAHREHLERLVSRVRAVYDGLLTYEMLNGSLSKDWMPGIEQLYGDLDLDVIGISAYFSALGEPLGRVPTLSELVQGWENVFAEYLEPLAELYPDKPIVFLEFGAMDLPGSAYAPLEGSGTFVSRSTLDANRNGIADGEEEQALILDALFEVVAEEPRILDGFFTGQPFGSLYEYRNWYEGCRPSYKTWGRPAHESLQAAFATLGGGIDASDYPPPLSTSVNWDGVQSMWFQEDEDVGWYKDGIEGQGSDSANWGLAGSDVERVACGITSDGVALLVQFHSDQESVAYRYVIELAGASGSLFFTITPEDGAVYVAVSHDDQWEGLGSCSAGCYMESASQVEAHVPVGIFAEYFAFETLRTAEVRFSADYRDCEGREIFGFPGSGRVVDLR